MLVYIYHTLFSFIVLYKNQIVFRLNCFLFHSCVFSLLVCSIFFCLFSKAVFAIFYMIWSLVELFLSLALIHFIPPLLILISSNESNRKAPSEDEKKNNRPYTQSVSQEQSSEHLKLQLNFASKYNHIYHIRYSYDKCN